MQKTSGYSFPGLWLGFNSQQNPSPEQFHHHIHDMYEILYVACGRGRYIIEGNTYEMRPGSLILVSPYVYHSVEIDPSVPYERYIVNFSAAQPEVARLLESFDLKEGSLFYTAASVSPSLPAVFEKIEQLASIPKTHHAAYAQLILSEILILLSTADTTKAEESEALGARVIKYLNTHIERDLTLDKIAGHFFVSKYYLCRAFKRHNGISIHGYLTQKRVMYAKQLMESGETASGAAYRVGFGDYSAFYRACLKVTGHSPLSIQKKDTEDVGAL